MKKHLLMLFVAMMAATMSIKAQTIVIDDGFENGIQDSIWTQEFVVGQMPWAVEGEEDSLLYPATVYQGKKRAYLRNTTGETQGYVTRLVSKVMDLSPDKVYQPILSFWYANPKWTADRDTLRVLYKTSAKANWKQLAEYSSASAVWQKVSISLPEVGEYYQVAFEGKDNLGRGIVLDSVKLRSAPECTVPHDLSVTSLGKGKVNIAWNASWDADGYDLIITTDSIDPDTVATVADSVIVLQKVVGGLEQNYEAQLESGAYYYAYVRSLCAAEKSMWNSENPEQKGQFYFRVKATKYLPYAYDFNKDYNAGKISRELEWTWGTNSGIFTPHINTNLNNTELKKYSNDGTQTLCFSGLYSTANPPVPQVLPAGLYAYAATPALADSTVENFSLSTCQVRFWTTAYTYVGRSYAHAVIVGVMTDAEDITTFVPVDTVSVWGLKTFQENIVDLSSYTGDGMYVAFLSQFETQNIFYVDNVVVEQKPAVNKVTNITVNPRDTFATISWEGNAAQYRVLVTNAEVDLANPKAENVVLDTIVMMANSLRCEGLEEDHGINNPYYVYVQAEGKEWSYRYPFVTIAGQQELPMKFDMEQGEGKYFEFDGTKYPTKLGIFSNDPQSPYLYATGPYKGKSCLYLSKDAGRDSWITFPMVDTIQHMQMTFYLSGSSTAAQAHATVGVMSNPMDISTFVPVTDFSYADGYIRCYVNFSEYDGPEGVIAIVWSDTEDGKNTINSIDDVTIEPISQCLPPTNISVEATDKTATVQWDKSSISEWEWIVSTAPISEEEWERLSFILMRPSVIRHDTLTWTNAQSAPMLEIDSLDPTVSYYFYVRSLCGGDEQSWWIGTSFRTTCSEIYTLPYTFTFDGQGSGSTARPLCWTGEYSFSRSTPTNTTVYPYLSTSYAHSGGTSLYMYSYFYRNTTTGLVTSNYGSMIVAPKLAEPLNEVLVEFWAYATSTSYELYVGTVSSPTDSDFVALDTIKVKKTSTWEKHTVDFTKYKGTQEYIAFRTYNGVSSNTFYVDDITFKSARCAAPFDIKAENATQSDLDVVWRGMTEEKWEVKVLKKYARLNTERNRIATYNPANVLIDDTVITASQLHIDGLSPLQRLYVYVRPLCGDSIWAMDSVKAGCKRLNPMQPNRETFETYPSGTSYDPTYQADCWTVGITPPNSTSTNNPYIYKSSTYASSGENVYRINESSSYAPAWAASPEIICDNMKNLLVSFSFYASSSYYGVWGVMTDPEDLGTFVALDSIKGSAKSIPIYVDLKDYADSIPDEARYFAWRGRYNAADLFYIDDVSIIEQTCPMTNPSYSDLEGDRVRISSGLRTNDKWELLLLTMDIPTDSLEDSIYVIPDSIFFYRDTLTARSKVVTGLEEKTAYFGYTRALCEEGNSQWRAFNFRTPCKAVTPEAMGVITFDTKDGYTTGQGGYLPCWTVGNKNPAASGGYIPWVYTTASHMHNGLNSIEIWSSTTNNGSYAIMPQLKVDSIKDYQVNFWGQAYSTSTYGKLIVGVVTDPSDLNTFVVIDTVSFDGTNWKSYTVSFENYEGDYLGNQGKYVMFIGEFPSANDVFISEVSVEKIPTCRPVSVIAVDSIMEDGAMFSWEGYSEKYRLLVSEKELADSIKPIYDKYLIDTIVSVSDSVEFHGLEGGTTYYAYVQGICAEGDSSKISMLYAQFFTNCPITNGYKAPYKEDFEKLTTANLGCWEGYNYKGTGYPKILKPTSGAQSGYMLEVYSTSTTYRNVALMPKVQGNLTDYMLSFDARSYGVSTASVLYIGTMSDITDSTTFVPFDTLYMAGGNEFYHKDILLADYAEKLIHSRIAFTAGLAEKLEKNSDLYIDNVRLGLPPTCYPPTLEAGKSTLTTAKVKITPNEKGGEMWELAVIPDSVYSKAGFDAKEYLDTVTQTVMADKTEFEITGLKDGTIYYAYARTVCGGEDGESDWTEKALQLITKFYYKDSYSFGFEKSEKWIRSPYATADTYYQHPALAFGYDTVGTATTSYSYYPYGIENTTSYIYGYGPKDGSKGKGALRLYGSRTSTADYYGDYVVFPAIAEPKARSFEFKVRPGYLTASSMKVSTTYHSQLQVGTIDKDGDMTSFEVLGTIDLPILNKTVVANEGNNFLFTNVSLDFDSATMANKQIVLYQPKCVKEATTTQNFIDDVKLGATKGYSLVSLGKIDMSGTAATIHWDSIGGPWNLYVSTYNEDEERTDTIFGALNLSNVYEQAIAGLKPQTKYTVSLVGANAPAKAAYKVESIKTFTTPCKALEPNAEGAFFWDFNDASEWEASDMRCANYNITNTSDTAFHKPGCFTTGWAYYTAPSTSTVNYNWMIIRKGINFASTTQTGSNYSSTYTHYEYGRDDSPALKAFTSSSYNTKPYIVFPELNCSFDTMMIEFYGRCFANYDATHTTASNRNKMTVATYLGAAYCKSVVIGTVTDPDDFSTFEPIDTLTYKQTSLPATTLVTNDPTGQRYWEKMQMPLSEAKGKYLVIYQPAYGCFFIDDLSVKPIGDNIFAPFGAKTETITTTGATFSWKVKHPTLQSVVVVLNADDNDKEVIRDTIVGTEYAATNLKPATIYTWYMYQINGENKSSETERLTFTTECLAIDPSYTTGFEGAEEGFWIVPGQTSDTYKQNKCWIYGNAGTNATVGTNEYNQPNTASAGYSHTGSASLKMYAYGTTLQTYAAMPALDVTAYDTLQVNFWMRPGYHGLGTSTNADKISTQYTVGSTAATADYYYAKSVIVGTMTDPNDPTTFVAIDTINYNGTFAVGDDATAANDYLFQKKKVSLRGATGPYVAFFSTLWAKGAENKSTYDYVWLDDISFSLIQECDEPVNMFTKDITAYSAKLQWTQPDHAEKYVLQVSTDPTFYYDTAFVFNDTVYGTYQALDSLLPQTEYAWRVQTVCGEEYGVSEFTQNVLFKTNRVPFFLEDFRETSLDGEWDFGTTPAVLVIDSADVEINGSNSTSYGFRRVTNNYGIYGAHYAVPFYSSSTVTTTTYDYYWMISPTLYLPDDKEAHLTMDMALTQSTSSPSAGAATEANMADDFTFLIALSEDGGKTWKKENILGIWNNTLPAGSQVRDLPLEAANYRFDLSKYTGKNVRIAFYRQAETYLSTTSAIHIGNIRVAYFDNFAVDTTACQYQDVEAYGISIDGDKTPAGKNFFKHLERAGESDAYAGALDTIYNLTVTYLEAPETIIADTICAGDSYTSYDFSGKTRSGVYRRKLQSAEHCDSIVTLRLFVAPIMTSTEQDTICFGKPYEWHGQQCNRTGLYTDTMVSIYGCDSIVYLNLTVRDQITAVDSVTICYGGSYNWNGNILSAAGIYKDTLESVDGCDSIVTMTVNVASILVGEPQKQDICEGNTFTWLGKVYDKAGTYRDTIQSADGCDSIAILELTVAATLRGEPEEISICRGESYKWNNAEYTQPGTYRDTVASSYGCDSIITLVLAWYAMEDTIYTQSQITVDELPFTYENPAYPYAAGQSPIFFAVGTEAGVYTSTVRVEGKHCETYMVHTLTIISTEGLEDVSEDGRGTRKVLYNDNLYIICNDEWYNAAGQKVSAPIK